MLMLVRLFLQYLWTCEEQGEELPDAWEKLGTFSECWCNALTFAAWLVPQMMHKTQAMAQRFSTCLHENLGAGGTLPAETLPRAAAGFQRVTVRQQ